MDGWVVNQRTFRTRRQEGPFLIRLVRADDMFSVRHALPGLFGVAKQRGRCVFAVRQLEPVLARRPGLPFLTGQVVPRGLSVSEHYRSGAFALAS